MPNPEFYKNLLGNNIILISSTNNIMAREKKRYESGPLQKVFPLKS